MNMLEQYLRTQKEFELALAYSLKIEPLQWFLWVGDQVAELTILENQIMELGRS